MTIITQIISNISGKEISLGENGSFTVPEGSYETRTYPGEEYTTYDLNYNSDCRANREQNDNKSRPEIKNTIDISKYDTII